MEEEKGGEGGGEDGEAKEEEEEKEAAFRAFCSLAACCLATAAVAAETAKESLSLLNRCCFGNCGVTIFFNETMVAFGVGRIKRCSNPVDASFSVVRC